MCFNVLILFIAFHCALKHLHMELAPLHRVNVFIYPIAKGPWSLKDRR